MPLSNPYSPPDTPALDAAPVIRPRPFMAVLLSVVASGAGYYYAGARWRLVALAVLVPVLLLAIAVSVHAGLPAWTFAVYALFSPLVLIDTFRQARRPDARRPPWLEMSGVIVACLVYFGAVSGLFRAFVLDPFYAPSASMAPALLAGDSFLVDKLAYVGAEPERGDIAMLRFPDDTSVLYVKRVIGLPGDVLRMTPEGDVEINGTALLLENAGRYDDRGSEFSLLREATAPSRSHFILRMQSTLSPLAPQTFHVPEGAYFMLGDNRDNSKDSRRWMHTFVPRADLLGRAIYRHWSRDPESGQLRLERVGKIPERVDLPTETSRGPQP